MQLLSNLNLTKNELQNARIQNLATDPASPVKGQIYFNTTSNELKVYNGTIWKSMDNPTLTAGDVGAATTTHTHSLTVNGDISGSVTLDNTADTMSLTLANSGVTAGTYSKVTVDAKGRVTVGATATPADIGAAPSSHTHTLSQITDAGTAAGKDYGSSVGNLPVIGADGKLDAGILPAIAITDTFVVATQAAMLALTAQTGDVAVRTDVQKTFILKAEPATTLANWQELISPTDGVSTFSAGTTGLTPSTPTAGAVTLGGTLIAANGGTGFGSYTIGDILYASATNALSKLADVATGSVLISGGVGAAPSYGKVGLTTHVSGTLPVGNGGTGLTATTQGGVMYGSSAAGLALTAAGTSGQVLKSNGTSAPTWITLDMTYLPDAVFKKSVKAATTADLGTVTATTTTLTGGTVVFPAQDGVTIALNDRILVKNQTTAAQNGIYYLSTQGVAGTTAWVLTRVIDADIISELAGAVVNVDQGTVNGGWLFSNQSKTSDTLGTTAVNWYRMLNTLDLASPAFTGTPTAPTAAAGTNSTQIATTAYVTTAISNHATATAAPRKFTSTIGDGAATTITKAHGLGNADVVATVRDATTGEVILCDMTIDATNIVLTFATAPAANAYKLVAIG